MTMLTSMARLSAIGGLCLLACAARAEVPANGSAYIDAAVASVESMIRVEQGKSGLPRLADPVDGKVLADVWDDAAILGKAPYGADDIPALLNIVQKQTRILQIYMLYSASPGKAAADPARNATEFQDELTRTHVFLLKAVAATLDAINDFGVRLPKEERTDVRFEGLRQMRKGLVDIVGGAAAALRNPALREPNQKALAGGFAETGARIVAGFSPADRTALVAALQAARPALKAPEQKAVSDLVEMAGKAPCSGLCLLQ